MLPQNGCFGASRSNHSGRRKRFAEFARPLPKNPHYTLRPPRILLIKNSTSATISTTPMMPV